MKLLILLALVAGVLADARGRRLGRGGDDLAQRRRLIDERGVRGGKAMSLDEQLLGGIGGYEHVEDAKVNLATDALRRVQEALAQKREWYEVNKDTMSAEERRAALADINHAEMASVAEAMAEAMSIAERVGGDERTWTPSGRGGDERWGRGGDERRGGRGARGGRGGRGRGRRGGDDYGADERMIVVETSVTIGDERGARGGRVGDERWGRGGDWRGGRGGRGRRGDYEHGGHGAIREQTETQLNVVTDDLVSMQHDLDQIVGRLLDLDHDLDHGRGAIRTQTLAQLNVATDDLVSLQHDLDQIVARLLDLDHHLDLTAVSAGERAVIATYLETNRQNGIAKGEKLGLSRKQEQMQLELKQMQLALEDRKIYLAQHREEMTPSLIQGVEQEIARSAAEIEAKRGVLATDLADARLSAAIRAAIHARAEVDNMDVKDKSLLEQAKVLLEQQAKSGLYPNSLVPPYNGTIAAGLENEEQRLKVEA